MPDNRIGLLGAGRQALETAGYCREEGFQPVFYVEEMAPEYDRNGRESRVGFSISTRTSGHWQTSPFSVRWGCRTAPPTDRALAGTEVPDRDFEPRVGSSKDCTIGEGCLVAPMAVVNRLCRLGDHVLVNVGATVSHDVTVGDFSTVSPGCTSEAAFNRDTGVLGYRLHRPGSRVGRGWIIHRSRRGGCTRR